MKLGITEQHLKESEWKNSIKNPVCFVLTDFFREKYNIEFLLAKICDINYSEIVIIDPRNLKTVARVFLTEKVLTWLDDLNYNRESHLCYFDLYFSNSNFRMELDVATELVGEEKIRAMKMF